jgi:LmbE family N-acetylglucosaminyl deacetylase
MWRDDRSDRPDAVIVQVVAHPDDDLYFLNPDVVRSIEAGAHVISVCVLTGETDGKNYADDDPRLVDAPVEYERYSAARQAGLRRAYALMAVGDAESPWRREAMPVAGGMLAELATLTAAPQVRLVFLNLWQDGARSGVTGTGRTRQLWSQEIDSVPTMRPTGTPVPAVFRYSREHLIAVLGGLFETFGPTVIRTMDPDPDPQRHDAVNRQHADYGDYSDHQDHTAVALFTWAAIQRYEAVGGAPVVASYRGYYNERWPFNLSASVFREKLRYLTTYGWADGHECGDPVGCGDRKVGDRAPGTGWGQSTSDRYPSSTAWLQRAPDGRLGAFAVVGGRVRMWTEIEPGGAWTDPVVLDGDQFGPALAITASADGRWHLVGTRLTFAPAVNDHRRDLTYASQSSAGRGFGAWVDLGNPYGDAASHAEKRRRIGVPAVVARSDGAVQVFARNFGAGLSSRLLAADGSWSPWLDLHGSDTLDGLAAVTTASGRTEVYATSRHGVLRYYQEETGGPYRRMTLPIAQPAGPPAVVSLTDGRLRLVVRHPRTGWLLGYQQLEPDGEWDLQPWLLPTPTGFGQVAIAVTEKWMTVVQRGDDGDLAVARERVDERGAVRHWSSAKVHAVRAPAVCHDANGSPVVAVLGADGALHVADVTVLDGEVDSLVWRQVGAAT